MVEMREGVGRLVFMIMNGNWDENIMTQDVKELQTSSDMLLASKLIWTMHWRFSLSYRMMASLQVCCGNPGY